MFVYTTTEWGCHKKVYIMGHHCSWRNMKCFHEICVMFRTACLILYFFYSNMLISSLSSSFYIWSDLCILFCIKHVIPVYEITMGIFLLKIMLKCEYQICISGFLIICTSLNNHCNAIKYNDDWEIYNNKHSLKAWCIISDTHILTRFF